MLRATSQHKAQGLTAFDVLCRAGLATMSTIVIHSALAFLRKPLYRRIACSKTTGIITRNNITTAMLPPSSYFFNRQAKSPSSSSPSSSSARRPMGYTARHSHTGTDTPLGLVRGVGAVENGATENPSQYTALDQNSFNAYNNDSTNTLNENSFTSTYERFPTSHMRAQVMIANESLQMNKVISEVFSQTNANVDMDFLWDYLKNNESSITTFNMGFIFKNLSYKLRDSKESDFRKKFFMPVEIVDLFNNILLEKVQTRTTLNELSLYYSDKTENMFWWVISGLGCIKDPHHLSIDAFLGTLSAYIDDSSISFLSNKDIASVCYALRFTSSLNNPSASKLLESIVRKLEAASDSVEFDTMCITMCMQGVKNFLLEHASMKGPMEAYLKFIAEKLEMCHNVFDNKQIAAAIEGLGSCHEKNETVKKLLDIFAVKIKIDNGEPFTAEQFASCMMGLRRMQGNDAHVSRLMSALMNRMKRFPDVVFTPDTISAAFSGMQLSPSTNSEFATPRKEIKDMIIYLDKMLHTIPHDQLSFDQAGHIINGLRNTNFPVQYTHLYGSSLQRIIEYVSKVIEMHPNNVSREVLKLFLNPLKGMKPSHFAPFVNKYIKVLLPKLSHFSAHDRFRPHDIVQFVSRLRFMDSREREASEFIGLIADIVKIDYKYTFKLREICLMYGGLASTHLSDANTKKLVEAINEKAKESLEYMEKNKGNVNLTDSETISIALRGVQKFSSDSHIEKETLTLLSRLWKYKKKDYMTVLQLQRLTASLRGKNLDRIPMRVIADNIVQMFYKSRDAESFRKYTTYSFIGVISTPLANLHYRCPQRTGLSRILLTLMEEHVKSKDWPFSDQVPSLVRACAAITTTPPGVPLGSDLLLPDNPNIGGAFMDQVSNMLQRKDKNGNLVYDFHPSEFYEMIENTLKLRTEKNAALDKLFHSICACYNPDESQIAKYLGTSGAITAISGVNRSVLEYKGGLEVIRKVTSDFAVCCKSESSKGVLTPHTQKLIDAMLSHEELTFDNKEVKDLYITILNAIYPALVTGSVSGLLNVVKIFKTMTGDARYADVDSLYDKLREHIVRENATYTVSATNPNEVARSRAVDKAVREGKADDAYMLLLKEINTRILRD